MTRLALAQRAHLVGELAARGITATCVIVADDENLEIARDYGFETVEQDNTMLGRKFNDGIEYACNNGADFVVSVGSDDWIHADLFDRMPLPVVEEREPTPEEPVVIWSAVPEIVTGRNITIVDLLHGRAEVCRAKGRYGVIPWVIPREALERSRFRPVREHLMRGIDGAMLAGMRVQPEWVFVDPHDVCRVDFKSETNVTSYESSVAGFGDGDEIADPWPLLAEKYPADLVELARATHLEMAA